MHTGTRLSHRTDESAAAVAAVSCRDDHTRAFVHPSTPRVRQNSRDRHARSPVHASHAMDGLHRVRHMPGGARTVGARAHAPVPAHIPRRLHRVLVFQSSLRRVRVSDVLHAHLVRGSGQAVVDALSPHRPAIVALGARAEDRHRLCGRPTTGLTRANQRLGTSTRNGEAAWRTHRRRPSSASVPTRGRCCRSGDSGAWRARTPCSPCRIFLA